MTGELCSARKAGLMTSATQSEVEADLPGSCIAEPRHDPVELARLDKLRVGPLTIDPAMRRICHEDGRTRALEPRMMQLLIVLLRADGAILTRDDLIASCWDGRIVGDDVISSGLYRLRRAL